MDPEWPVIREYRKKLCGQVAVMDAENHPLSGVTVGLFAANDLYAADGTWYIKKDQLIRTAVSGEDGMADIGLENLPTGAVFYQSDEYRPVSRLRAAECSAAAQPVRFILTGTM